MDSPGLTFLYLISVYKTLNVQAISHCYLFKWSVEQRAGMQIWKYLVLCYVMLQSVIAKLQLFNSYIYSFYKNLFNNSYFNQNMWALSKSLQSEIQKGILGMKGFCKADLFENAASW